MLKKDWLFKSKILLIQLIVIDLLFSLFMGDVALNDEFWVRNTLASFYQTFYRLSIFMGCSYPFYALKLISPQKGSVLKYPSLTAHLPYTKKQLMKMSLKPWLILFPIHLVLATLVYRYSQLNVLGQSAEVVSQDIALTLLAGIFVFSGIGFQFMYGLIKHLSKEIIPHKLVSLCVLGNVGFLCLVTISVRFLQIDLNHVTTIKFISMIYFVINLTLVLTCFKDMEKIYQ
ncbi:MAG: hypothetical protein ACRCST_07735 [Turicibacter sp.]